MSHTKYSISVIIPTYNRPFLARRAIASVLAQTVNNLEVIVVDDCSDHIFNVQDNIMSLRDERIRYERHTISRGPSAARNTGIEKAHGKFIAFLDDDDIWLENKLEQQMDNMNNYCASLCGFFTQYGVIVRKRCSEFGFRDFKYDRNFAINSGIVVKSAIIKNIRYDETLRVGEDIDFVIKILEKGPIKYLNKPYYFVNHGNHERITNEKRGDTSNLENRLLFVKKNMDVYGEYWGNFTIASILLREFQYETNKMKKVLHIIRRCGLTASSFAIYKKLVNKFI